jgi:hypothetical protein
MLHHHRGHFLAFGLLPALNTLALLIHGLNLSTHGMGNTGRSLVVILVASAVLLITAAVSAFKRARDIGFEPGTAVLGLLVSFFLGPVLLLVLGYLAFARARGHDQSQPSVNNSDLGFGWLWAPVLLVAPWMALLVASALP